MKMACSVLMRLHWPKAARLGNPCHRGRCASAVNFCFRFPGEDAGPPREKRCLPSGQSAESCLSAFATVIVAFLLAAGVHRVQLAQRGPGNRARAREQVGRRCAAHGLFHAFVAEQNAVRGFVIGQVEKLLDNMRAERGRFDASRWPSSAPLRRRGDARAHGGGRRARAGVARQVGRPAGRARAGSGHAGRGGAIRQRADMHPRSRAASTRSSPPRTATTARYSAEQDRASATVNLALAAAARGHAAACRRTLLGADARHCRAGEAITEAMQRLAQGQTDIAIPAQGRRDERARWPRRSRSFREAAIEKARMEPETVAVRVQARGRTGGRREAERAEAAASRARWSRGLGAGLARLSGGDLTFRLTRLSRRSTRSCAPTSTRRCEKLQTAMSVIAANAPGIRTGADEISQASDDLSRRTEQQAASLEETAAALDEITATVQQDRRGRRPGPRRGRRRQDRRRALRRGGPRRRRRHGRDREARRSRSARSSA